MFIYTLWQLWMTFGRFRSHLLVAIGQHFQLYQFESVFWNFEITYSVFIDWISNFKGIYLSIYFEMKYLVQLDSKSKTEFRQHQIGGLFCWIVTMRNLNRITSIINMRKMKTSNVSWVYFFHCYLSDVAFRTEDHTDTRSLSWKLWNIRRIKAASRQQLANILWFILQYVFRRK